MERTLPSKQRYVSSELTHFEGAKLPEQDRYGLLNLILGNGRLARPGFDPALGVVLTIDTSASICKAQMYSPQVVCLCDIPVADLDIHMQKYSRYGIAFSRSFLIPLGAAPVFYLPMNSAAEPYKTRCEDFDERLQDYHSFFDWLMQALPIGGADERRNKAVAVKRFLDYGIFSFVKFFDDSLLEDHEDNFYMEREWRLLGGVRFSLDDVERVILPKDHAKAFRDDFPQYYGQLTLVE